MTKFLKVITTFFSSINVLGFLLYTSFSYGIIKDAKITHDGSGGILVVGLLLILGVASVLPLVLSIWAKKRAIFQNSISNILLTLNIIVSILYLTFYIIFTQIF